MSDGHLKYGADGHLLHNAAGDLVHDCGSATLDCGSFWDGSGTRWLGFFFTYLDTYGVRIMVGRRGLPIFNATLGKWVMDFGDIRFEAPGTSTAIPADGWAIVSTTIDTPILVGVCCEPDFTQLTNPTAHGGTWTGADIKAFYESIYTGPYQVVDAPGIFAGIKSNQEDVGRLAGTALAAWDGHLDNSVMGYTLGPTFPSDTSSTVLSVFPGTWLAYAQYKYYESNGSGGWQEMDPTVDHSAALSWGQYITWWDAVTDPGDPAAVYLQADVLLNYDGGSGLICWSIIIQAYGDYKWAKPCSTVNGSKAGIYYLVKYSHTATLAGVPEQIQVTES